MDAHSQLSNRARKICEDHHLHLLYVPKCKVVDFDHHFIIEEKAQLLGSGGWESQKTCYQWAITDPQLQPYIKEVFRQLTVFIALTGFWDVKYNNISLTDDGRVALFDLDEGGSSGKESGVLSGLSRLFRMVPAQWCDELIKIAEPHLSPGNLKKLQEELPQLSEKDTKRRESRDRKAQFYAARGITYPTQTLGFDKEKFKTYDSNVNFFVEKTIELLNKQIPHISRLSLVTGRKVFIQTNMHHPIRVAMRDIGMSHFPKFDEIVEKGLKALQEQGYILSYKFVNNYNYFSVVC